MTELAKWVWIILLCILFLGYNAIWILLASVVTFLLVWWLRPEWLEKDPEARKEIARKRIVNSKKKKLASKNGHNFISASEKRNDDGYYEYFWLTVVNDDGKDSKSPFFEDDLLKISFAISDDFRSLDMNFFNKTEHQIQVDWKKATFMEFPLEHFNYHCETRGALGSQVNTRASISKKTTVSRIFYSNEMRKGSIFYPLTFSIKTKGTIKRDYSLKLQTHCSV